MEIYTYVEERYCAKCKKNVAVSCCCCDDGSKKEECLNKICKKEKNNYNCHLQGVLV